MRFLRLFYQHGVLTQLGKIVALLTALIIFFWVIVWIGNPYLDDKKSPNSAAPSWTAQAPVLPSTTFVPPPPGFPSMEFPPPLPEVRRGQPQPVPTRFGLSYSVPSDTNWQPSNSTALGWTEASYGAGSVYGYRYCDEDKSSRLAVVGVTSINGVDFDTAARTEVGLAEQIFADKAGRKPKVEIRGPFALDVSGRPAVRYTAVVTDIPADDRCDPPRAQFDIVATPAYATAEVMLLMVEHHVGLPKSLSDNDVDTIIRSLRKTDQ
ncbi:hypothetical protein NONI108955_00985 [Nocardia ninae]